MRYSSGGDGPNAGLGATACAVPNPRTEPRVASVGVIGTGYWGRNLVRVFDRLGALRVACDSEPGRVEGLELGPGVERRHDPEDVLADPQVKRVVIATPASTHFDLCRRALASGKDVFVEKPLALTVAEGTALVEQASAANLVLMVGHILQYHPAVLVLKEMLDRGELGRAEYIYSNRLNLGKLRTEENILWSFAPHDISVILALVGAKPTTVSAHGEAILQRSVCDVTLTSLEFPGDVKAHTFVSWLHPFKEQRLVVVGSEQMAVFEDSSASDKLTLYPHRVEWRNGRVPVAVKGERRVVPVPAEEPLMAECRHFLESCATRIPPRTDGQEGLDVLEVLAAAEESLRSGGRVVRCAMESDRREIRSPVMVGSAPSVAEPVARPEAPYVHPTAVVDPGAELGPHTKVWHWTHISRGVRIGRNCVFGQNVFVAEGVTVGDGCKVQNNVSLYKGVRLEQDVFCGPSCVFTNVLDPRAFIEKKSEFRDTVVRRGASIGANATVVCGHTLGEFCLVAAGAVVTKDVPAHALVAGVPARVVGWVCRCGARLVFQGSRATCRGCGDEYVRDEQGEVKALPTEVKS